MAGDWGRFTVRGSAALEMFMATLLDEVQSTARIALPRHEVRALILLGGYGRGEGGVLVENGEERPHNNLDFLIVAEERAVAHQERLRQELREALAPLVEKYGIEMDIGTTSTGKLARSPSLVMWYDMRFGHKTVIGNDRYVPSLRHFTLQRIPAWDIRNLLVNRGTLLVINDSILAQREPDEADRRLMIKHIVKALIGYGDARLFYAGEYDWSYVEKQRRMERSTQIDPRLKELYNEAVNFRFAPDYDAYLKKDIRSWMAALREQLAPIHLACESIRLGIPDLCWSNYLNHAFRQVLREDAARVRGWAKKARNLLQSKGLPYTAPALTGLGYRCLDRAGVLPLLFPAIVYDLQGVSWREAAGALLGAADSSTAALRRAYLRTWAEVADVNFNAVIRKWRINLDEPELSK